VYIYKRKEIPPLLMGFALAEYPE